MTVASFAVFETAAGVGAVIACILGVLALVEKVTGKLGSWVQRQVEHGTKDVRHLTEYHLGPNSGTEQLWRKVDRLQGTVDNLRADARDLEED